MPSPHLTTPLTTLKCIPSCKKPARWMTFHAGRWLPVCPLHFALRHYRYLHSMMVVDKEPGGQVDYEPTTPVLAQAFAILRERREHTQGTPS